MELVANYTKQNQKVTKQSASLYQKQLFFKRPFSKQKLKRITIRNQCTQHAKQKDYQTLVFCYISRPSSAISRGRSSTWLAGINGH